MASGGRRDERLAALDAEWTAEESASAETWQSAIGNGMPYEKLVAGYPLVDLAGNISYTQAIYLVVKRELPDKRTTTMLEACFTGIIDHGFRNTVAVATRFVASANPDPIAAIAAGILGIGRHTAGAQRYVIELIEEGMRLAQDGGLALEAAAEQLVSAYLARRATIPGLGTKLHKKVGYDVRSVRLRETAARLGFTEDRRFRFYELVHRSFSARKRTPVVMNIDGMMGAVLAALEFDPLEAAALEVVVMLPSLIGHALEEIRQGGRLRYLPQGVVRYVGPGRREVPEALMLGR